MSAPAPVAPASLVVQATVDPAVGGSIASADAVVAVAVTVPAGQADVLNLTLAVLVPNADGTLPQANLQIGGQSYAVTFTDSTGSPLTTFEPPLTIIISPPQALVEAVGGDLTQPHAGFRRWRTTPGARQYQS